MEDEKIVLTDEEKDLLTLGPNFCVMNRLCEGAFFRPVNEKRRKSVGFQDFFDFFSTWSMINPLFYMWFNIDTIEPRVWGCVCVRYQNVCVNMMIVPLSLWVL